MHWMMMMMMMMMLIEANVIIDEMLPKFKREIVKGKAWLFTGGCRWLASCEPVRCCASYLSNVDCRATRSSEANSCIFVARDTVSTVRLRWISHWCADERRKRAYCLPFCHSFHFALVSQFCGLAPRYTCSCFRIAWLFFCRHCLLLASSNAFWPFKHCVTVTSCVDMY